MFGAEISCSLYPAGRLATGTGMFPDVAAFKLGDTPQHSHNQLAVV
jgi:hypothetical protein